MSLLLNTMMAARRGGSSPTRPSELAMLLHFDDADGSQTFTDLCGNAWAANDSHCVISHADAILGSGALSLPNYGSYIGTTWPSFLSVGTGLGDSTQEFRWTPDAEFASSSLLVLNSGGAAVGGTPNWWVYLLDGILNVYGGFFGESNTQYPFADVSSYIVASEPNAIAIQVKENVLMAAVNGHVSSTTYSSLPAWSTSLAGKPFWIGSSPSDPQGPGGIPVGVIDEFRWVNLAMFSSNYTVPTSEFAFANPTPYN